MGQPKARLLEAIRAINTKFPYAKVVAVDIPSGLAGDSADPLRAKFLRQSGCDRHFHRAEALSRPLACARAHVRIAGIGSPASLLRKRAPGVDHSAGHRPDFARLRGELDSNKRPLRPCSDSSRVRAVQLGRGSDVRHGCPPRAEPDLVTVTCSGLRKRSTPN